MGSEASSLEHDPVKKPEHYRSHPSGVECKYIVRHLPFCIGNTVKYLWRATLKSESPVEDLRKAAEYIDFEIELAEDPEFVGFHYLSDSLVSSEALQDLDQWREDAEWKDSLGAIDDLMFAVLETFVRDCMYSKHSIDDWKEIQAHILNHSYVYENN